MKRDIEKEIIRVKEYKEFFGDKKIITIEKFETIMNMIHTKRNKRGNSK